MSDSTSHSHGPIVEPHDDSMGYPPESHGGHMGHDARPAGMLNIFTYSSHYVFLPLCHFVRLQHGGGHIFRGRKAI